MGSRWVPSSVQPTGWKDSLVLGRGEPERGTGRCPASEVQAFQGDGTGTLPCSGESAHSYSGPIPHTDPSPLEFPSQACPLPHRGLPADHCSVGRATSGDSSISPDVCSNG